MVNSAGNSGDESWGIVGAPADASGVFTIGAVDASGIYASFSSRGNATQPSHKPDVVAQGASSFLIGTNDGIGTASGTSFSSPIMAGAIACFWQSDLSKTNSEIMQLVRESSTIYNSPTYSLGYGIPDFLTALTLSDDGIEENISTTLFPNPTYGKVRVLSKNNDLVSVTVYNTLGNKMMSINSDEFDISFLAEGIYLVYIKRKNYSITVKLLKF